MQVKKVELISVGSELLSGKGINTHAQGLSKVLTPLGYSLSRDTTIPDHVEIIKDAVLDALPRCDLLILTGGLGPTHDDLTREGVAQALDRKVVLHEQVLATLAKRYQEMGKAFTESRKLQAKTIEGALILPNPAGAAPGLWLTTASGTTILLLPGPPAELHAILQAHVVPRLKKEQSHLNSTPRCYLRFAGIGESDTVDALNKLGMVSHEHIIGIYANAGLIDVVAQNLSPETIKKTEKSLQNHLYSISETVSLLDVIATLLQEQHLTLSVAESCTGGGLGKKITERPGSSLFFLGGIISYANDVKTGLLKVNPQTLLNQGAVSEATAIEMVEGVCERTGSDCGLSITGIAGPEGGSPEKPIGSVWIGCKTPKKVHAQSFCFPGNRTLIRSFAIHHALHMLWQALL